MSDTVSDKVEVAPREITDLAYRACRVAGCGASLSDTIAADVTYCEIQFGGGIDGLLELIEATPCLLREHAIEARAHAESGQDSNAESRAVTTPFVLRCRSHTLDAHDVADRYHDALANGVAVDVAAWQRLERQAAEFLLAERIIDGS